MFPDETTASDESAAPKKRAAKKRAASETTGDSPAGAENKAAPKKRASAKKTASSENVPASEANETPAPPPASNLKSEATSSASPPGPHLTTAKSPATPGPSLFDELSGDQPTRPATTPKSEAPKPAIAEDKDEVPRPRSGQIMSFDPDEDDSPAPAPVSAAPSEPSSQIKNQESRNPNPAPTPQRPPLSAKDRLQFLKQKKFGNAARSLVQPNPGQPPQTSGEPTAPTPPAPPASTSNLKSETGTSPASPSETSAASSPVPSSAPAASAPAISPPKPETGATPASPRPPQQAQPQGHPNQRPPQPPPQARPAPPPRAPQPPPPKGKPGRHGRHPEKEPLDTSAFWPGDLHNDPILANAASADAAAASLADPDKEPVLLNEWFKKPFKQLLAEAQALGITFETAPTKSFLNAAVIRHFAEKRVPTHVEGILFLSEEGDGAIVYTEDSYRLKAHSTYLSHLFVARYGLRKGQIIRAQVHPRRDSESCPFAVALVSVMGRDPKEAVSFEQFEELVPYYPLQRIMLENDPKVPWDNNAMRVFDLLTPIGLGQRSLIVAPPRTGKTVILQCIANTVAINSPQAHLIVLLVDERPEEVTDFSRQVKNGEVISSTFDETAESHVHAAEMVIEKARRMVEVGRHVIILLDSITRLGRAYNTLAPNSGKILSGGVEATALQRPKRFFGSARNIEGGGSLTIIGTALVETGSRMDEVIFEEFKGTGNMELHLDRALSDKRIFPAINLEKSGTRKEELLYHPMELEKVIALRRAMKGVPATDAMEMLITRVKKSKTNAEFLVGLNR